MQVPPTVGHKMGLFFLVPWLQTQRAPKPTFHSLGPSPRKGPRVASPPLLRWGLFPRPALLCWPQLLPPPGSLHHGCLGGPGAVWRDQNLLSRHPVKRAAHVGGSLHKAREQGRTRLPTGQHEGPLPGFLLIKHLLWVRLCFKNLTQRAAPRAFQQARGLSRWEAEACGGL